MGALIDAKISHSPFPYIRGGDFMMVATFLFEIWKQDSERRLRR